MWVRPTLTPTEMPGLVLASRREADGWEALVTWIEPRGRVATDWVKSEELRPVKATPNTGLMYG